ncbi:unnamed protein product [Symbiodinium sp. CCMP2592]|nr:unnamed protein product [Symbiodinium sp. CCMP2592]
MDQLKGDLAATANFLQSMTALPNYDSVREVQAKALCQRVKNLASVDANGASALLAAWTAGKQWTSQQTKEFSDLLAGAVRVARELLRKLMLSYLSVKDIQALEAGDNIHVKLDVLACRCIKLRLTCPSEACCKAILAAGLARAGGDVGAVDSYANKQLFKKMLKSKAKGLPKNGFHLEHYPASPDNLPPELADAYSQEDPACTVQMQSPDRVQAASSAIVLRGSSKKLRGGNMMGAGGMQSLPAVCASGNNNPMNMQFNMGLQGMQPGMTMMGMMNTMNNMMQRLMQDQNKQQQDPIPNMQYFAPGGGQAGATTMGQGPAAGTQAPAAATQQAPAGASASVQQTAGGNECISWCLAGSAVGDE